MADKLDAAVDRKTSVGQTTCRTSPETEDLMDYVIPAPPTPSLAVEGTDARFPVHRIYCVGRNYAEHAREMGGDPDREPPFFFMKPRDAIVTDGNESRTPRRPETFTTRWSWSSRSARAARTSRQGARSPTSMATPPGST